MFKNRRRFLIRGGTTAGLFAASAGAEFASSNTPLPSTERSPERVLDPTYIDLRFDSRSISFENPTGARGAGGKAHRGRKGRPLYVIDPGEKVILADIAGVGTIRHIWTPFRGLSPEVARALRFEVFYDGLTEPSISVPLLDFFGLPHGRLAEYYSAMVSVNEGKGLNSYFPMPFGRAIRIELTNESDCHVMFFYQIDYTVETGRSDTRSYLHATFRRENPTELRKDFVIARDFEGPGRFLGCSVGIRVLEKGTWYGEGELKIYRDGDREFPTYCGTGLEDYVGGGYGLERHWGEYAGSPIQIPPKPVPAPKNWPGPDYVSFYRWHIPDPIMFESHLKVTLQQIGGSERFGEAERATAEIYQKTHIAAGPGWGMPGVGDMIDSALLERSDDYCATAYVYCSQPQGVARYDTQAAVKNVALTESEIATPPPSSVSDEEWERFLIRTRKYWSA